MCRIMSLGADLDYDAARDQPLSYEGQAKIAALRAVSRDVSGELRVQEIRLGFRPDKLEIKSEGGTFSDQPLELSSSIASSEASATAFSLEASGPDNEWRIPILIGSGPAPHDVSIELTSKTASIRPAAIGKRL